MKLINLKHYQKKNISYLNALNELSFRKGIDEKKINFKSLTYNEKKNK